MPYTYQCNVRLIIGHGFRLVSENLFWFGCYIKVLDHEFGPLLLQKHYKLRKRMAWQQVCSRIFFSVLAAGIKP
jgi:hypothetical protein